MQIQPEGNRAGRVHREHSCSHPQQFQYPTLIFVCYFDIDVSSMFFLFPIYPFHWLFSSNLLFSSALNEFDHFGHFKLQ